MSQLCQGLSVTAENKCTNWHCNVASVCDDWGENTCHVQVYTCTCVRLRVYLCVSCMCSADEQFQAQKYAELEGDTALVEEREGAIRQLEVSSYSVGCMTLCSLTGKG